MATDTTPDESVANDDNWSDPRWQVDSNIEPHTTSPIDRWRRLTAEVTAAELDTADVLALLDLVAAVLAAREGRTSGSA